MAVELPADPPHQRQGGVAVGQSGVVSSSTSGRRWAAGWLPLALGMSGVGDAAAGGHMIGVGIQQCVGQFQHGGDPLVGQPVVDDPVL
jgi:hypothetical protein